MYEFDWSSILGALPILGQGMLVTLKITATAIVVGIVWGTLLALARLSDIRPLGWLAAGYVNLFRAVPLVMVILWFYLIVPALLKDWLGVGQGSDIRMVSALVAFALFESAYYAEIIRAGVQSVPKGQVNAAYALGMPYALTMRLVVLPQAFRNMLPLLLTQAIILFQDTSLVYVISATDFTGAASKIAQRDGRLIEMYLFVAVVYFVLCYTLSYAVKLLQKKIAVIR